MTDQIVVGEHRYLVQTEDYGPGRKEFLVTVFEGGQLVYRRGVAYSDLVDLELSDTAELLSAALRNLHNQVLRDLGQGLLAAG